MGVTTPTSKPTGRANPVPPRVSELTVLLWLFVVLIALFVLTCWWFARLYSA